MKVFSANLSLLIFIFSLFLFQSCKDEEVLIPPVVTTTNVTALSYTTATSGGNIVNTGGGSITARGVCWDNAPNPAIDKNKTEDSTGSGSFTSNITGLSDNTQYFVRAYAINSSGIAYGEELSFTTLKVEAPSLSTSAITYIGDKLATSGGNVTSENGSVVTEKGVCWSTTPVPTINNNKSIDGTGIGAFISSLTGLSPNTIYYARAYATNGAGTSYGNELSFETFELIDIDGNGYNTVTIGSQVWLDRNLRTAKYSNGDLIPTSTTPALDITVESSPKYQWAYGGDINNVVTYGRLYTWYVATDNRNVCLTGWHVPSESEQMALTSYLGGPTIAGGKLKESGTTHWLAPNTDASNSSLFTALPGGLRYSWGLYLNKGSLGFFWSTSDRDAVTGYDLYLDKDNGIANHGSWDKNFGMSIRCIKD
jgi:uncharacterized protein (TIGR02145 family)